MTMLGYLTLDGAEQGNIQGGSTHVENENEIEILRIDHEIKVPSGSDAKVSAGQPVHGGVKINKLIDKSTPKLAQALCTREQLSEVVLAWYHHTSTGTRELVYKIVLKNALITKISAWSPHMFEQAQEEYRLMEDITFSYESIIWSYGSEGDVEYEIAAKGAQ